MDTIITIRLSYDAPLTPAGEQELQDKLYDMFDTNVAEGCLAPEDYEVLDFEILEVRTTI